MFDCKQHTWTLPAFYILSRDEINDHKISLSGSAMERNKNIVSNHSDVFFLLSIEFLP